MRGFASCRAHGDPKRILDANNRVYDAEHANGASPVMWTVLLGSCL
jgi:hypothetical protein